MEHETKNKASIAVRGFTLVEIVVAITIAALLVFFSIRMFGSFRDTQVLQGETSQAVSLVAKAQSYTLNSKADSEYGVRINGDQLILFKGLTFASSSPDNEAYVLHPAVGIASTTLSGGGLDIIFDRLTGDTSNDGSFAVYLKADMTQKNTIYVNKTGAISQN
jgi:prepilin-type N-terminal cleavage/methylation domain-containing protein